MTDYLAIVLNGFSTGLGVIVSQWFWNKYLEHRANNFHENVKKVNNTFIDIFSLKKRKE